MKELWCVYKTRYIEDFVLLYATNETLIEQYCKETNQPLISDDEFWESYEAYTINAIEGHKIKEIVFED